MSKATVSYICGECGGHTLKWQGQCPSCGAWNTLVAGVAAAAKRSGYAAEIKGLRLADVEHTEVERASTGIAEFDRVLGGGLVTGSVVLIGGDPGIGKSTLLLQAAGGQPAERSVLYVTGEESLQQIAMRARRLEVDVSNLNVLAETCVEHLVQAVQREPVSCIVVDSIQTMYSEEVASAPGSVTQREPAAAPCWTLASTSWT